MTSRQRVTDRTEIQEEVVAPIPWPKVPHGVPEILSGGEVMSLLDAIETIKHRAVIVTAYGAGLRVSERG